MPMLSAIVAHDTEILSETKLTPVERTIAQKIIERTAKCDGKSAVSYEGKTYHTLVENRCLFVVTTADGFSVRLAFGFLEELKDQFKETFAGAKHKYPALDDLNPSNCKRFNGKASGLLQHYNNNPQEADKLTKVKSQIEDVKSVMIQNIDSVLERGDKIEDLVDATDQLMDDATGFHANARVLRNKMWWRNVKLMIAIGLALLFVGLVISWIVCGITYAKCGKDKKAEPTEAPSSTTLPPATTTTTTTTESPTPIPTTVAPAGRVTKVDSKGRDSDNTRGGYGRAARHNGRQLL